MLRYIIFRAIRWGGLGMLDRNLRCAPSMWKLRRWPVCAKRSHKSDRCGRSINCSIFFIKFCPKRFLILPGTSCIGFLSEKHMEFENDRQKDNGMQKSRRCQ